MSLYTAGALCFAYFLPDRENENEDPKNFISFLVASPLLLTSVLFSSDYDAFGVSLIFLLYLGELPKAKAFGLPVS